MTLANAFDIIFSITFLWHHFISMYYSFNFTGTGLPINKIVANSVHSYPISYYVSALVPNFNIDACLSVSYKLVLSVGFARNNVKSSFMDLSVNYFYHF